MFKVGDKVKVLRDSEKIIAPGSIGTVLFSTEESGITVVDFVNYKMFYGFLNTEIKKLNFIERILYNIWN